VTVLDNVTTSIGISFTQVSDQYRTGVRVNYSSNVSDATEGDNDFLAFTDELFGRRLWFERDKGT
jgi:capsid protein